MEAVRGVVDAPAQLAVGGEGAVVSGVAIIQVVLVRHCLSSLLPGRPATLQGFPVEPVAPLPCKDILSHFPAIVNTFLRFFQKNFLRTK